MKLVMEKYDDVFIFSTFFYVKLLSHGVDSVLSWHKKVDLITKRLLIFPVHQVDISHWCLVVADVPNKHIAYFDSIDKENSHYLVILQQYLFKLNGEHYSLHQEERSIPRQSNSYDCGVFTCLYARFLAANCRFHVAQKDIAAIREQMQSELLQKKLLQLQ